jgi:hypothetical protein
MKAEADRDVAAAGRSPDVAARLRKRKAKIDTAAERIANMTVTVGPACRNLQPFSSLWKYEQGQPHISASPRAGKPSSCSVKVVASPRNHLTCRTDCSFCSRGLVRGAIRSDLQRTRQCPATQRPGSQPQKARARALAQPPVLARGVHDAHLIPLSAGYSGFVQIRADDIVG